MILDPDNFSRLEPSLDIAPWIMRVIFRICGTCALLIGAVLTSLFFQDKTFSAYVVRDLVQEQVLAGKKLAVIMTPYDLSPGGGEKYTLDFCHKMQLIGLHVVLLAYDDNYCANIYCLAALIERVRVPVKVEDLSFRFAPRSQMMHTIAWFEGRSEVYFQLGNSKAPIYYNPARVRFIVTMTTPSRLYDDLII